jgi:hypothetical protein
LDMNLTRAICQLHEAESKLAAALRAAAGRHGAELGTDCDALARHAESRAAAVAAWAARCKDQPWEVDTAERRDSLLTALRWRRRASDRRRTVVGSPLIREVRRLHQLAEDCQIQWARVGCGARQADAAQLLDLVAAGHHDLARTTERLESLIETATPFAAVAT